MIRFTCERVCNLVLFWCITVTLVRCELPELRNPSEFKLNRCTYRNIYYESGEFVRTGEPCLNCTCTNGVIVCHLRVCSPIPNPPPPGCFVLHKKESCCSELFCNEDNNVIFDGLEGRSRPGANDDTEVDLENFRKSNQNKGCLINGTTYAEGSALSSSTDCKYCFCMKGKEQCVRPNCILQLAGCTPVFKRHACCPVKYNCHGSDNVTIVSTELSLNNALKMTTPETNEELLSFESKNRNNKPEFKPTEALTTSREFSSKTSTLSQTTAVQEEPLSSSSISSSISSSLSTDKDLLTSSSEIDSIFTSTASDPAKIADLENSTSETVTDISTSITLVETEVAVLKQIQTQNNSNQSNPPDIEERHNTYPGAIAMEFTPSTAAYNPTGKINSTSSVKTIPVEIEAILNITKKKQEGEYELDYDEPTLPPSLPNLKIIPFVAADALDKPKDHTIQHREDTLQATEPNDLIMEVAEPQSGQFSPPVKTEGGFVPRDPILDGPFFESKYSSINYHPNRNPIPETQPEPQVSLPSITESPKIVENALCTNGYLTYRHGELISEPKACNMCLCLFGEIVCQEPKCPPVKDGCHRVKYSEDVTNCCGETICDETTTPTSTSYSTPMDDKYPEIFVSSTKSNILNDSNFLQASIYTPSEAPTTQQTILPVSPTIMTIKVKAKNSTTTTKAPSTTAPHPSFQPLPKYTFYASPTSTTLPPLFSTVSQSTTRTSLSTLKISQSTTKTTTQAISEKPAEADYDNGFSLENMLSFLFDEPPTPTKNVTSTAKTTTFSTSARSPPSTAEYKANTLLELLSSKITTTVEPTTSTTSKPSSTTTEPTESLLSTTKALKSETDSAIYMIKNENAQSKTILNYTDLQENNIEPINSYFVPPLGNFEEVILNPTKKPFPSAKKPLKSGNSNHHSTTYRPRHTTAKVIPLGKPYTEKNLPQVIAADPGAASGLLKLSGCNIFGKMYRLGQSIAEISTPCSQCRCAEIGVDCTERKC